MVARSPLPLIDDGFISHSQVSTSIKIKHFPSDATLTTIKQRAKKKTVSSRESRARLTCDINCIRASTKKCNKVADFEADAIFRREIFARETNKSILMKLNFVTNARCIMQLIAGRAHNLNEVNRYRIYLIDTINLQRLLLHMSFRYLRNNF